MSEIQYRADYLNFSVDEIEVVNETQTYVDIKLKTGWLGGSLRREAKDTSQSTIHKTKECALKSLERRAEQEYENAGRELNHWIQRLASVKLQIEKLNAQSPTD